MRKSFRFRRKFRRGPEPPRYNINQKITAPEVRLVDENGENIGVITTKDALARAQELGLDLIEVSPKAVPPVAKILNYGSFKYQEEKQKQKQKAKQKKTDIKSIRITFQIGPGDKERLQEQAREFLDEGHKVKIELMLRGRQKQYKDKAIEIMKQFAEGISEDVAIEQNTKMQGGKLHLIVGKKVWKRSKAYQNDSASQQAERWNTAKRDRIILIPKNPEKRHARSVAMLRWQKVFEKRLNNTWAARALAYSL